MKGKLGMSGKVKKSAHILVCGRKNNLIGSITLLSNVFIPAKTDGETLGNVVDE